MKLLRAAACKQRARDDWGGGGGEGGMKRFINLNSKLKSSSKRICVA
jgi:hypothetical protein